jgi:hypothetical protein
MTMNRREFVQTTGYAALGATLAANLPAVAQPTTAAVLGTAFDINATFSGFMKDIGGTPADGGGKVTFTGETPILRSHFRIGAAMALPAMGAAVGAAAIWRERTGHDQELSVGVLAALRRRAKEGGSYHVRVSLARAAMWYASPGQFPTKSFDANDPLHRMIEPELLVAQTPYGRVQRLGPQVKLSKTTGKWRDPLVAVRGGDTGNWV